MRIFDCDNLYGNCGCKQAADTCGCGCNRPKSCCRSSCAPCPPNPPFPPCPPIPPAPVTRPYLSSYLEVVADTQNVAAGADVVFIDADVVGTDIAFTTPGSVITINTPGLYRVEWNANVSGGIVMGILENGETASAATHSGGAGNIASGSLINVTKVPFTLSLRTFSGAVTLSSLTNYENTAASIRITKVADGAKV